MNISNVMNKAVIIDENLSVKQAAKIMSDKNIGSLIIVKENNIKGIITERDILKNINKLSYKVGNIMSKNIITIDLTQSIDTAAELMFKNKIKRLPVMKERKLVGLISATDIIANIKSLNEDFFFD